MNRQHTHADWALLLRGQLPERPDIQLHAEIELSSTFVKFLLDSLAFLLMLLSVFVLTFLVAIPNAQASVTLLEGITSLAAGGAQQLGRGPVFCVGFGIIILSRRFAERNGAELLSSRRCTVVLDCCHDCPLLEPHAE